MRTQYYQVTGRGPWMVDFPGGVTKAHRPGQIFEASPSNKGVVRGLRAKRLRQLSDREANALRATKVATAVKPRPLPAPKKTPSPKPKPARADDTPIAILDDEPK